MKFEDAFNEANKVLTNWKENGVALAGEAEEDWLFRGHIINNDTILTGTLILVSKEDGKMRICNTLDPRDNRAIRTAKVIELK